MSSQAYKSELSKLSATYAAAMQANIDQLKSAIAGASDSSVIAVGSGGSFTVASLLCKLHEAYTGRVSRASTPLEIICNPTLASSSPVFFISAEGRNPDITEALERARLHSARPVHVLTNRDGSPLSIRAAALPDVSTHRFELHEKDGYLATNSLLLNAVLIARAYSELDGAVEALPKSMEDLKLGIQSIADWIAAAASFVEAAVKRGAVVVTYSPLLHPIAADLESKLSEGALLHCQVADLRSFAHGRHLWLAERPDEIAILALTEPSLGELWTTMARLFPKGVPTFTLSLAGARPRDLVAGLLAEMHLIQAVSESLGKDPGRPEVPAFGRELYYVDLPNLIPPPTTEPGADEHSKSDVLGAKWPFRPKGAALARARRAFTDALAMQFFRAVVFDYDGTLVTSQRRDAPPSATMLSQIKRLTEANVLVGIASGRGGSVQEHLAEVLPAEVLGKIYLGLYNGGWIGRASSGPERPEVAVEFLSHVTRIARNLEALGVPIEKVKTTPPHQVSIQFREGLPTHEMWYVIADALRQAGLPINTLFRSKHSIDVLALGVDKSSLIAHILQTEHLGPHQVLTVGDHGAWPGNDVSLLEHRFSLSVDLPSRRIDRGWKLAPSNKRAVDATAWYLERFETVSPDTFRFVLPQ